MEKEKLFDILELHREWLESDKKEGKRADLRWADLQESNLWRADLQESDLQGANLRGADLQESDLQGADLRRSDLRGANLRGANLQESNLQGAKNIISIQSQYPYQSYGYYCNNQLRVRLGCFDRTIEEWEADFWNNDKEFPKDSPQGKNRFMIYDLMKEWLIKNK